MTSFDIVHKNLEHKRKCLKLYENKMESNEFLNALLKEIDELEHIEKDLMVFDILLKYIKYEENYCSTEGHGIVFTFDRIILKALNNFDLNGTFNVKDKIFDFVIVKQYLLNNKVDDSQ